MDRHERFVALLPELVAAGLLDAGGGSAALRTDSGVVLTPTQASRALRWKLSIDDLVLFPGSGEASMARAGRQPSLENRLHRSVLAARPDWNCTLLCQGWGLLGFALASRSLPVPRAYSWPISRGRGIEVPLVECDASNPDELSVAVNAALAEHFPKKELGAVLVRDFGPFLAGTELEAVLSFAQSLETLARAQAHLLR